MSRAKIRLGGLITLDEALRRASNPDEFKLKIQGVQFTSDVAREQMESQLELADDVDPMAEDSPFEVERFGDQ